MVSEAGHGKTLYARTLAKTLGLKVLICNHIEGLKELPRDNAYNGIIFDDFCFAGIDTQQLIAILDSSDTKDIRILHQVIKKKPGTQIVTLNKDAFVTLLPRLETLQMQRRITTVFLKEPLVTEFHKSNNERIAAHSRVFNSAANIEANKTAFTQIAEAFKQESRQDYK